MIETGTKVEIPLSQADLTLTRYAQEYANDPEFIAEGLAMKVIEEMLKYMEQKGLNQSWLAEKMGVSRAHISRILNASPNMTLLTIAKIAVALGVTPDVCLNTESLLRKVKMKITKEALLKRYPCTTDERLEGFLACFPGGIVTLAGSLRAARAGYDLNWVVFNLLPPVRREAWWEALAAARIAYEETTAPAGRAYEEATALAFFRAFQEAK